MKNLFDSTNWIGYAAAIVLVLISFAAVFLSARPVSRTQVADLPAIADVDIKPGFVGHQSFGLWTLVCEDVSSKANVPPGEAPPKRICRTNARVTVRGPNNAVLLAAGFNVLMLDTKTTPAILFRLPPSARAAARADFAIDQNTTFQAPLRCSPKECLLQGALPAEAVAQMRSGRTLSVIYTVKDRQQQDRKVRVDQLLHGFRESYDAMVRAISA
jgi:invasion protein IalB